MIKSGKSLLHETPVSLNPNAESAPKGVQAKYSKTQEAKDEEADSLSKVTDTFKSLRVPAEEPVSERYRDGHSTKVQKPSSTEEALADQKLPDITRQELESGKENSLVPQSKSKISLENVMNEEIPPENAMDEDSPDHKPGPSSEGRNRKADNLSCHKTSEHQESALQRQSFLRGTFSSQQQVGMYF